MISHARVVVIGGGIAGCALLYSLARAGCRDALLIEKGELTVGSTWHASGNTPHYSLGYTSTRLMLESTRFYESFARETGEDVGFHKCGSLRLGRSADEVAEHRRVIAQARYLGVPMEEIGFAEAKRLLPYLEAKDVISVVHTPADGYLDPSSLTHALARQARALGAQIERHTRVTGMTPIADGWRVLTDKGDVTCETVVNAAGLWGRELALMVGYRAPMVPFERQYVVTEPVRGLKGLGREIPVLRDIRAPMYMRQEVESFLLGLYDPAPVFWATDGTPPGFEQELLVSDIDRVSAAFVKAIEDVPILGELGVRRMVNGPIMRTADGNPLVGFVPGIPGYFMNSGHLGAFTHCGGLSPYLAEWILDGAPSIDLGSFDLRRFGDYATRDFVMATTRSTYAHEFGVTFPQEEPYSGHEVRTSPLHDRLEARGAVFGYRNGWEVPNWFAPKGMAARDEPSFRRANWFPAVAAECRRVDEGAALADLQSIAKLEVHGLGAERWLQALAARPLPADGESLVATPLLGRKGGMAAFVELARLAPDRFYLSAAAIAEQHLLDLLTRGAPEGVTVENLTETWGALLLAGPATPGLVEGLVGAPLATAGRTFRRADTSAALVPLRLLGVTALGRPAVELHCPAPALRALHEALGRQGAADLGWRALDWLRLEAGAPRWGVDFGPATPPAAIGLGSAADASPASRLVKLELAADVEADPTGGEPVWQGERMVGITSSGGHDHRRGVPLALAFVAGDAAPGDGLALELLGRRIPAAVAPGTIGAPWAR